MNKTIVALVAAPVMFGAACGGERTAVLVDGSSTVFPVTEAMAEEFQKVRPRVFVTVGKSGTGGGFKKFCVGETDINDASRTIKASEEGLAQENGIAYIELPIAFDGISVVAHRDNSFVDSLTVEELKKIWQPGSTVSRWSDIRPEWPDQPINLYGPGTDSGTFDYFTEAINGKSKACRPDFTASEDDNVLVRGVAGDPNALGFFGYAYYKENADKLKVIPVDGGAGPVTPTLETIGDGTYQPLSRPIFIYVGVRAAERPEVREFTEFYLDHVASIVEEVGYVPLPDATYDLVRARFAGRVTGSAFNDRDTVGVSLEELIR